MKPITKAELIKEDRAYGFQPELTKRLDGHRGDFDQATIKDITLWKVNRYPVIESGLIAELNKIKKTDEEYKREKLRSLLIRLLAYRGVQLPMASTYLRFKNPKLFQIIDQRVYRALYGTEMVLPGAYNAANRKRLVDIYFNYLDDLRRQCEELGIPFEDADRILYNVDKRINKTTRLKNY